MTLIGDLYMNYTGYMRTTLSKEERTALKNQARSKGMTLVGFYDSLCRDAIKKGILEAQKKEEDKA